MLLLILVSSCNSKPDIGAVYCKHGSDEMRKNGLYGVEIKVDDIRDETVHYIVTPQTSNEAYYAARFQGRNMEPSKQIASLEKFNKIISDGYVKKSCKK